MKRFLALTLIAIFLAFAAFGQSLPKVKDEPPIKVETTYDVHRDQTTIRMAPMKISGKKDKYQSLQMSPSYSYPGRRYQTPSKVDFELQTVVSGRLRTDLYVVFIIDGETIFLSSSRWGIKRPVPGRVWMGERLVFNMPYATLLKLANAKVVAVKLDGVAFEFDENHKRAVRVLWRRWKARSQRSEVRDQKSAIRDQRFRGLTSEPPTSDL